MRFRAGHSVVAQCQWIVVCFLWRLRCDLFDYVDRVVAFLVR